jgi:hypothetical protein
MYKKTTSVLVFILFFNFSYAHSQDVVVDMDFKPFATTVLLNGNEYTGILLSEEYFEQVIKNKIELNFYKGMSDSFRTELDIKNQQIESILDTFDNMTGEIERELETESWWEKNKSVMSFTIGVVLGAGFVLTTVYATNKMVQ